MILSSGLCCSVLFQVLLYAFTVQFNRKLNYSHGQILVAWHSAERFLNLSYILEFVGLFCVFFLTPDTLWNKMHIWTAHQAVKMPHTRLCSSDIHPSEYLYVDLWDVNKLGGYSAVFLKVDRTDVSSVWCWSSELFPSAVISHFILLSRASEFVLGIPLI